MPRKAVIIPFPVPPPSPPSDPGAPPRASRPFDAGRSEAGLVEVHRCSHAEALVVRSLLESHGIPVLVRSRIAQSVHPFTVGTQGEIVLLVPEADARRSRRVLGRVPTSNLRRAK